MPTNDTTDYATEGSTQTLQSLAQKAGNDTREEALAAKDTTPVSKLTYTASCREVTEYYTTHHKISSTANIVDYQKIESHYKPEVFALINGPVWIRPQHTAVVIPLLADGNPTITVKGQRLQTPQSEQAAQGEQTIKRRAYDVVWKPGSIHYIGGDVTLDMAGGGRAVFIFLLFKMRL